MGLYVSYNGMELSKYINVLKGFTTKIGADWNPELIDIGNVSRGERFKKTTYKPKEMPMPFEMVKNTQENYDEIQKILNVNEPKPLIIGGELNRVYMAVPYGNLDFDDIGTFGKGEIVWLIPSGYGESVSVKQSTNNQSDTITIQNDGTDFAPASIIAKMKSDNGYIGIALGDSFYQIGNPQEVDGIHYEKSELLFDDHLFEDKGWLVNQGITPPVTKERLQNGTIGYVKEYENEGYAKVTNYTEGDSWHGAALTKEVPQGSDGAYAKNWRCAWRFDFNTDGSTNKGIEIGHNSVTFSDQNDQIICSIVFEDNNAVYERSDMAIYIKDKRVWDTRNTNKFYVTGRGDHGPSVTVEKIGNQITIRFSYANIVKTFFFDDQDAELRKITWYGAAYKQYTPIRNNLIRALQIVKHNVHKYDDIPNYFSDNDLIEIYGDTGEVYINGIYDMDMVDIGSSPIMIPPGIHTIGITKSSFATIPDVTVSFKERYI